LLGIFRERRLLEVFGNLRFCMRVSCYPCETRRGERTYKCHGGKSNTETLVKFLRYIGSREEGKRLGYCIMEFRFGHKYAY